MSGSTPRPKENDLSVGCPQGQQSRKGGFQNRDRGKVQRDRMNAEGSFPPGWAGGPGNLCLEELGDMNPIPPRFSQHARNQSGPAANGVGCPICSPPPSNSSASAPPPVWDGRSRHYPPTGLVLLEYPKELPGVNAPLAGSELEKRQVQKSQSIFIVLENKAQQQSRPISYKMCYSSGETVNSG